MLVSQVPPEVELDRLVRLCSGSLGEKLLCQLLGLLTAQTTENFDFKLNVFEEISASKSVLELALFEAALGTDFK